VRDREFLMDGWTPQLAYTQVHRAQVSGGNRNRTLRGDPESGFTPRCLHLALTETFDAYEHWCGKTPCKAVLIVLRMHDDLPRQARDT
jgi:hypothetical protein